MKSQTTKLTPHSTSSCRLLVSGVFSINSVAQLVEQGPLGSASVRRNGRQVAGSSPARVFSLCAGIQNAHSPIASFAPGLLWLAISRPKHENELQGANLVFALVGLGIG